MNDKKYLSAAAKTQSKQREGENNASIHLI